jgi:hypothetical protein
MSTKFDFKCCWLILFSIYFTSAIDNRHSAQLSFYGISTRENIGNYYGFPSRIWNNALKSVCTGKKLSRKINFWPLIYQLSNILFAMQMIRIVPIIAFNSSALDKQIFAKLSKPVNLLVLSAAIDVDHCASVKMHRCMQTPIIRSLSLVVENVGKVPTVTDERWIQKWH